MAKTQQQTSTITRSPLIGVIGNEVAPIVGALEFFKIPFCQTKDIQSTVCSDVIIAYGKYDNIPFDRTIILCIPSDTEDFYRYLHAFNVNASLVDEKAQIPLVVKKTVELFSAISKRFVYTGSIESNLIAFNGVTIVSRIKRTNIYIAHFDFVQEFTQQLQLGIDLKPTFFFKLITYLNIPNLVPRRLGDALLKSLAPQNISAEHFRKHMWSLDSLRYLFLAILVFTLRKPIPTLGFWKNAAQYALMITHDVDTELGFSIGINRLREIEKKLNLKSAWNIPATHYNLANDVLKSLSADGCEVASHGLDHDGKLILLNDRDMIKSIAYSRETLQTLLDSEIKGFRSPLLQHSKRILKNLAVSGFTYDSSIPAWEVYCRTSGAPHGVASVFPFIYDEIVELTVTMPQDHQLLKVAGLDAEAALELWKAVKTDIKSVGGLCNVIIHPDMSLFGNDLLPYYERVLTELVKDVQCWVCLPSEVALHWLYRQSLRMTANGTAILPNGNILSNQALAKCFGFRIFSCDDFYFLDS